MTIIRGTGVSGGIAKGPLYFYRWPDTTVSRKAAADPAAEKTRLAAAQEAAIAQLNALAEKCRADAGEEMAALFETHAMFVEDEDFVQCITDRMGAEGCSAEYAVGQAGAQFAAMFAAMDDAYLRERAADVRDVTRRLLDNLTGAVPGGIDSAEPVLLAADGLAPSETLQLDRSKILGFITRGGSGNSHTAILARTMGIPAVCGAGDALREDCHGRLGYLDGGTGQLILDPDPAALAALEEKMDRQAERQALLETMKGREDVTLDGRRVIIRTLDVGADKQAAYFGMKKEENPALGLRGVRICLNRPEVFRTQLRALYRASAYGKIAILFPMITSVWEVWECLRICGSVRRELEEAGIPFDPDTETGVMIETPAAVLVAEELAELVDFFSVGTNDLTQYLLACDRQAGDLGRFFNPRHPAVLRALKLAADAAHRAGIWIGVCGELAADLTMLPTFLAMGIDELSVSPASVLPLRAAIRQSTAGACTLEKRDC